MWDPPRPGIEPVSSALADGFLSTVPPGKSLTLLVFFFFLIFIGASLLYNGVLFSALQRSGSAFEFIIRKSEVYGIQKETDDLLNPCVSNSLNMCLAPSGLQVLDYILGIWLCGPQTQGAHWVCRQERVNIPGNATRECWNSRDAHHLGNQSWYPEAGPSSIAQRRSKGLGGRENTCRGCLKASPTISSVYTCKQMRPRKMSRQVLRPAGNKSALP